MRNARTVLFLIAAALAGWVVFSRLRIVFLVRTTFWQIVVLFLLLTVVLFLALDWLFRRWRR